MSCCCGYAQPLTPVQVPNLQMFGRAFDFAAVGGVDEHLFDLSTPPTTTTMTLVGNRYVSNAGLPVSPCSGRDVQMIWASENYVELTYGNQLGANAGGVVMSFTSALTGLVTWPTLGVMTVGQERFSNPLLNGLIAKITYVSGQNNANAPAQGPVAGCGVGTETIQVHLASVNAGDFERFRISFYKV